MSILFPSELTRTQEKPPRDPQPTVEQPEAQATAEQPAEAQATAEQPSEAQATTEQSAPHPHFHPGKHRENAVAHPAASGVSHLDAGSVIFR